MIKILYEQKKIEKIVFAPRTSKMCDQVVHESRIFALVSTSVVLVQILQLSREIIFKKLNWRLQYYLCRSIRKIEIKLLLRNGAAILAFPGLLIFQNFRMFLLLLAPKMIPTSTFTAFYTFDPRFFPVSFLAFQAMAIDPCFGFSYFFFSFFPVFFGGFCKLPLLFLFY